MFWFDPCAGAAPFTASFLDMFSITVDPHISVEAALTNLGRLAFRRPFGPLDTIAWHDLLETVALHEPYLDQIVDPISWDLEPLGKISTKSPYRAIAGKPTPEPLELIWSIRLPLKIRIFM
ncbi:hypothetical protein ZWY2020_036361 [Hordeum vulgare]|nr:hypothetical protein ZWY2020_036361 [Hordeum vulgare]